MFPELSRVWTLDTLPYKREKGRIGYYKLKGPNSVQFRKSKTNAIAGNILTRIAS
jgi:hypothetical protein